MTTKLDITLDEFLSRVNKKNTLKNGQEKDPHLLRRMQHPTCQKCHVQYKEKYPGKPFQITCEGIYTNQDFVEMQAEFIRQFPDEPPTPIESADEPDIREIYDASYWASKHIVVKDDDGDIVPFVPRWYQTEILQCTANKKVDRMGRGTGKTSMGVAEELHRACNRARNETLVVCPADSQAEKWDTELSFQFDNSPSLMNVIHNKKQQPFRHFKFNNGSVINIFTAGSSSGRGADSMRSQSPRRMRCEEQDYLNDKDWNALEDFLDRYPNSEFHGSSTPKGDRAKFWEMCTQLPWYKEFYFPISVLPGWNEEMEIRKRLEAKTQERYQHEYLAEFGDSAQGVFKNHFVDLARTVYRDPNRPHLTGYATCNYDASQQYFLGVDWNGKGTGTRIRVVEYTPSTGKCRCVDKQTVDHEGFTVFDSIDAVAAMNRKWHAQQVFIDAGYGGPQGDMLVDYGTKSNNPDDKRLQFRTIVDFGATLEFNHLKPNRDPGRQATKEEITRPTKPFMVEGAVMRFEQEMVEISDDDPLLDEQLRAYRVKTYSQHGWANTYVAPRCGDHDLDAFMLALLAVEIHYGFYATQQAYRRMAQVSYVGGFGVPTLEQESSGPPLIEGSLSPIEQAKRKAGVGSRTNEGEGRNEYRLLYLSSRGATVAPVRGANNSATRQGVPSRTEIFRTDPKSSGPSYGGSRFFRRR